MVRWGGGRFLNATMIVTVPNRGSAGANSPDREAAFGLIWDHILLTRLYSCSVRPKLYMRTWRFKGPEVRRMIISMWCCDTEKAGPFCTADHWSWRSLRDSSFTER